MNKKVIVLATNGSEETEFVAVLDVLRRAEIPTLLVSTSSEKQIITSHKVHILADALLSEIRHEDYSMLVIAGGLEGVKTMQNNQQIFQIINEYNEQKKGLAAICAAPLILNKAGVLKNRKVTCYPDFQNQMDCKEIVPQGVCTDEYIITATSVAYTFDFALQIVKMICGMEKVKEVADKMIYKF